MPNDVVLIFSVFHYPPAISVGELVFFLSFYVFNYPPAIFGMGTCENLVLLSAYPAAIFSAIASKYPPLIFGQTLVKNLSLVKRLSTFNIWHWNL